MLFRSPVGDAEGGAEAADAGDPQDAESIPEARVELTETHLAIDARGRAWGVSRFDLVAEAPIVRVRIPAGMRLFEVFVDGRVAVEWLPSRRDGEDGDETWDVRLLDVRWPRSVVAVFAGEIAGALPVGGRLAIDAAAIVGLPCRRWAWVVEHPQTLSLRPEPPLRAIDADGLAVVRGQALDALAPAFAAAVAAAPTGQEERLEEELARRRREAALPLPARPAQVGEARRERGPGWAVPLRIVADEGDSPPTLLLEVSRGHSATLPGRLWATAAMLACFAALWETRRRTPAAERWASGILSTWWALPTAALLAGVVWASVLEPIWPGCIAVAIASATLLARVPRRGRVPTVRRSAPFAATDATRAAAPAAAPGRQRRTGEDGSTGSTVRRR